MEEAIDYLMTVRKSKRMNQSVVGRELGFPASLVSRWENKVASPTLRDKFRYAHTVKASCNRVSDLELAATNSIETHQRGALRWLVAVREDRGISQRFVGDILGVSQSTVSQLERSQSPSAAELFAYAHAIHWECEFVHRVRAGWPKCDWGA